VYVVRCCDGTFYTGYTNDVNHRLTMHNAGRGAKYTKGRTPVELCHVEVYDTKGEALRREYEIKQYSRKRKLLLFQENALDSNNA
jgi:putative endonuclease